tara:strand:- start:274 stop:1068 length:795 start_codon:yes stop_codon:yes gene_type:complete
MSLDVDTGRNNNRDVTWLENDNSIEMPLSPVTSESSNTSSEFSSSQETSQETSLENSDIENQIVNRYVPPSPLSENETINPFVVGSINNILDNCNTSVIPFRDKTNNIVGTLSYELQQFDLDCPICFDPLDTSDIITMDCCKKQLHLKCVNKWHLKNINSETKDLCIMCRTKSSLMTDIYNTISLTVCEDDYDDEESIINNILSTRVRRRRRRRRRRSCDDTFQHAICATIFLFVVFLIILLINGNSLGSNEADYNRTNRHHHI